jgi:HAE1 family hydrophobic/amphiphilic exporter-1
MTSIAMGAGIVPIAIGWGADVEFRSPMAIAVLGGLISSTFLSLLYIPAVFTIVDDVAGFGRRLLSRMFAGQRKLADESPTPAE